MLTRLGEAGADAFTIIRIAGHSSATISQSRYSPAPNCLERAFARLHPLNERAADRLPEGQNCSYRYSFLYSRGRGRRRNQLSALS